MAALDDRRIKITGLTFTAQDSFAYFTQTIRVVLDQIYSIAGASEGRMSNQIHSYIAFIEGKERAGQERAARDVLAGATSDLRGDSFHATLAYANPFMATEPRLAFVA